MDFSWIYYIGMNKLGFNYTELGFQTLGFWTDMFESYKRAYNFETQRGLYKSNEEEPISSLDVL